GADSAALHPQVPAAEIVLIVHAGEDGARRRLLGELHPGAVGEALVLVEIAGVGHRERAARLALERLVGDMPGVPTGPGGQSRDARRAIHRQMDRLAVALA